LEYRTFSSFQFSRRNLYAIYTQILVNLEFLWLPLTFYGCFCLLEIWFCSLWIPAVDGRSDF